MTDKIKPSLGYSGELEGVNNGLFLTLACPACNKSVQAFTIRGLVDNWNAAVTLPKVTYDN